MSLSMDESMDESMVDGSLVGGCLSLLCFLRRDLDGRYLGLKNGFGESGEESGEIKGSTCARLFLKSESFIIFSCCVS